MGDFGLAVALDQTRLTQPGLMVGTVAYMAPEQALGGNVSAQSDLYALGCVLYELVCGRPPFIGEESVAIITQHLNTPPVLPSWHRGDVPRALEQIILRLLEKDPSRRPASAAELLSALETIYPAPAPSPAESLWTSQQDPKSDATVNTAVSDGIPTELDRQTSPLYQQAFVGREEELRKLERAFDSAVSGQGELLMVVGEPGIGKTSLCEQLATYAAVRGGRTLVGHCYEEGSLSLPYLPFVEIMRAYVRDQETERLRDELGTGAVDVARVVSEIRDRIGVEPRSTGGDPEEERWRLLQASTNFLRSAAAMQPLVLVLEDLHWCDRGTLDLLQHLARNLTGARLLVIGTYRDVEVDRGHPLSSALAELRRVGSLQRLILRGLTVNEVHRMMNQIRGQEVPWSRAEAIHRQTEGNPLFVQEVLRYLVEEGLVVREGDHWVRADDGSPESGIPEGLRDVIGKRLSRLSAECNQVLSVAAVIGRDFSLDTLQRVAVVAEDQIFAALEEALRVGILQEHARPGAVWYRFAHAFFRQTLYEEMIAPRRLRLHQQVARALEAQYANRIDEHAPELAEHFAQSTDGVDLAKAVHYGELAAQRATSVYAYGESARHLEQALHVQSVLDSNDAAKQCELLLALGEALLPAGEPRRAAEEIAPQALALAESLRDDRCASRACQMAVEGLTRFGGGAVERTPEFGAWAERADRYAAEGTLERVFADHAVANHKTLTGHEAEAWMLHNRALDLSRKLGDREAMFRSAWKIFIWSGAPQHQVPVHEIAEEVAGWSDEGVNPRTLGTVLFYGSLCVHLDWGERARAEESARRIAELGERTQEPSLLWRPYVFDIVFATLDGRFEDARQAANQLKQRAEELGMPVLGRIQADGWVERAHVYMGDIPAIQAINKSRSGGGSILDQALRAWESGAAGRVEEAEGIIFDCLDVRGVKDPDDQTRKDYLLWLLEASVLIRNRRAIDLLLNRLSPLDQMASAGFALTVPARHLAAAAEVLGDPARAYAYYQQALRNAAKLRFRPEIALIHLQLGELIYDHFPEQHLEAQEHLDFAIGELRSMNMQPALQQALRRKLQVQGISDVNPSTSISAVSIAVAAERPNLQARAAPDGTVTLMFTDIEDSTRLTLQLGDAQWLDVLRAHHSLVRELVQRHSGFEVKNQGDGFMLAFSSARRALDCAVAIQRALAASTAEPRIRVRMGLHTGEALRDDNDFHGRDVVLAARIADQARGGEILVSEVARELTRGGSSQFDDGREVELMGLNGAHRVYALRWN